MYKSFIYSNDRLGINLNALLDEEGEIWFIGKEITDFLEYKNSRKALKDHVDIEDKGVTKRYTLGGKQEMTIINESGFYSLILRSKTPKAKEFKKKGRLKMYESFDFTNDRLDIKLNAFKDKEEEIWFIGKEVAEVLGIKDTRQALRNQVLEEDKLFLAGEDYKKFVGGIQHPHKITKSETLL